MQASPELPAPLKVVIVDDHTMVVELITDLVGQWPGFKVVGSAASCREAEVICQKVHPDFVILDLGLPDASGLEAFRRIKEQFPKVHVLIFSGNLDEAQIRAALIAGVDGILSKASATAELRTAVQSVSAGRAFLCGQTSETVRLMVSAPSAPAPVRPALSKRERTVLRHIAHGLSSKQIAAKLGLSCYTVNNFRAKLSKKTGLHGAVPLSLYAARMGLLNESIGSAHPGW
jgi:two-component system nitrate/nitrite response regulator NarL